MIAVVGLAILLGGIEMSTDDFAIDDFKLALDYLRAQFDRLWQRFSFFLTVQMALFGFLGWLVFDRAKMSALPVGCMLGLFISVLWYVVSAEDRALVDAYRNRAKWAAERIAAIDSLRVGDYGANFIGYATESRFDSPLGWYWQPISITRLPAWISLVLSAAWLALWLRGASWLQSFAAG
jgi:hypothetical protein